MIIIGHRGACGIKPENTLLSFKEALKYVRAIELDVYVCRTGELVVIHDDTVGRTTNGHGYVEEMTLEELKKLDAGNGEKIPTLKEVFALVNNQAIVNIELKGKRTAAPVLDIINEHISKGWKKDNFSVSSFNFEELKEFFNLCPKIKIGLLIEDEGTDYMALAKKLNAYSINPYFRIINDDFVKKVHEARFKIFVWTVNTREDAQRLEQLGVDGIITNYPNIFKNKR